MIDLNDLSVTVWPAEALCLLAKANRIAGERMEEVNESLAFDPTTVRLRRHVATAQKALSVHVERLTAAIYASTKAEKLKEIFELKEEALKLRAQVPERVCKFLKKFTDGVSFKEIHILWWSKTHVILRFPGGSQSTRMHREYIATETKVYSMTGAPGPAMFSMRYAEVVYGRLPVKTLAEWKEKYK
jgi:hypothetical protein